MANAPLAKVPAPGRAPSRTRQIVKVAAAKVAPRVANAAKKTGALVKRGAAAGGRLVASAGRRGGRAIVRVARENWKTFAMNEGLGAGSHAAAFFLDRAARNSYLQMFEGNPILQAITKPSTILAVFQSLGLAFTKAGVRKFFREALRGTLHAKLAASLHEHFPDTPQLGTQTRGVDEGEEVAGPDEPEAELDDEPEEVGGPDEPEAELDDEPRAG